MKKLTDTLLAALVNEDRVSIVSVTTEPGLGVCHTIKEFAKNEDLSFIEIRTAALDALDFVKAFTNDENGADLGYSPVRHHLMSDEPVVILIDEVAPYTFDKVQRLINQIGIQARAKVLVALVGLRTDAEQMSDRIPEGLATALKHPVIETGPFDLTHSFVEFLREQKKTDAHLKVADFIEENGLSGASPQQWQAFAISYDMKLFKVAEMSLGNEALFERFQVYVDKEG